MHFKNTMRDILCLFNLSILLLMGACVPKGNNPADPYEPVNREIHKFNMAFDATFLRPPAKLYKTLIPGQIRVGINNVYNNVYMLPTVANDILQAEWRDTLQDTWRFIINSTIGIGGIFDVAAQCDLPPHINDLGITFAKWGDKHSPYIVIPFLGPSTIRDGMGLTFDYAFFTPYPYIQPPSVLYSILGLRYVDLRSQILDSERIMQEAIDQYSFIRDAYLQRRDYLISGQSPSSLGSLYVEDDGDEDLLTETPADGIVSEFPLTTAGNDVTHSPSSA